MHLGFTTVSLYSQNADIGLYASIAKRADELGFESMWAGHHIALPTTVAPDYPHTATEEIGFEPKPAQRPHPPIIYGGSSPVALRRAARLDGCYLPGTDLTETLHLIDRARAERGRGAL